MAENLQLCNTTYIMNNRRRLTKRLNRFIRNKADDGSSIDTLLFYYVANDILSGYKGLLKGQLPDFIFWCIDLVFFQQAITLCCDQMPKFFLENKILFPSVQWQPY